MGCKYADIAVAPEELSFLVTEGWGFIPPYQYVKLRQATTGLPAHWAASTEGGFLSIRPMLGELPANIQVGCKSVGMAPGLYAGAILITSDSGVAVDRPRIPVILNVIPKTAPGPTPKPEPAPEPEPIPEKLPPEYDFPQEPVGEPSKEEPPPEIPKPKVEPAPEPSNWLWHLLMWLLGRR